MEGNKRQIGVLIAEELPMFREALRSVLEREPDIRIIDESTGDRDVLDHVRKLNPDVLLLDLMVARMSGLELLRRLADAHATLRTVVLVDSASGSFITQALALGVRGVIAERSGTESLIHGIRAVASGDYWVDKEAIASLIEFLHHSNLQPNPADSSGLNLTRREVEVVSELVDGRTNKEIASKFAISEQTVKHHLTSIFAKTGAANRLELALLAMHRLPFVGA